MICPTSLAFFLLALSPAAWNSRNRRRISLWSALSRTIASDDMVFPPGGGGGGGPVAVRDVLPPAERLNALLSGLLRTTDVITLSNWLTTQRSGGREASRGSPVRR